MGLAGIAGSLFNSPLANLQAGPPLRIRSTAVGPAVPAGGTGAISATKALNAPALGRGSGLLIESIWFYIVGGAAGLGVTGGAIELNFSDSASPPNTGVRVPIGQITATGLNLLAGGITASVGGIFVTMNDLLELATLASFAVPAAGALTLPFNNFFIAWTIAFANTSGGAITPTVAFNAKARTIMGLQEN